MRVDSDIVSKLDKLSYEFETEISRVTSIEEKKQNHRKI